MNGAQYRCVATNGVNPVATSNPATLTVGGSGGGSGNSGGGVVVAAAPPISPPSPWSPSAP